MLLKSLIYFLLLATRAFLWIPRAKLVVSLFILLYFTGLRINFVFAAPMQAIPFGVKGSPSKEGWLVFPFPNNSQGLQLVPPVLL